MATPHVRTVVLWVLGVGLLVSGSLATKIELDKRRMAAAFAQLEQERDHLSQELALTRQTLEDRTGELAQLQAELEQTEQSVAQLRLEQATLQHANLSLTEQLAAAVQAQHTLEAKLSSLQELKAAIRVVKHQLWQQRWQAWRQRVDVQRATDERKLTRGNRGFVVRNGASTLGSPTRLQVRVHEPQPQ